MLDHCRFIRDVAKISNRWDYVDEGQVQCIHTYIQTNTVGYINEKKLTKHICQPKESSVQTGILPIFWLLSTSLFIPFYVVKSVPTGPEQGKIPCHFSEHTGKVYAG